MTDSLIPDPAHVLGEHRAVPSSSPRTRESWVDVAKGMAIILVVLFHSSIFLRDVGLAGSWGPLTVVLYSFRMPLFFFTAGLFAAKLVGCAFCQLFRRRIANLIWVYAVWSAIWMLAPRIGGWQAVAHFLIFAVAAVVISRLDLLSLVGVRLTGSVIAIAAGVRGHVVLSRLSIFVALGVHMLTKKIPGLYSLPERSLANFSSPIGESA